MWSLLLLSHLAAIKIVSVHFRCQREFDRFPIPLATIDGSEDFHRLSTFFSGD